MPKSDGPYSMDPSGFHLTGILQMGANSIATITEEKSLSHSQSGDVNKPVV
jgi:hypothetical protein